MDDLATFLEGVCSRGRCCWRAGPDRREHQKLGHWALAVLEVLTPSLPPATYPLPRTAAVNTPPLPQHTEPPVRDVTTRAKRPPILYNDPRIQLVYELRREKSSVTFPGERSSVPPPIAPIDSDEEDRHDSDDGFPAVNTAGQGLKMQISVKMDKGFRELKYGDFGGLCWQILTGIEARTKFSDSELRHEGWFSLWAGGWEYADDRIAQRIWKRQMNYHVRDNNCQQFCILLATAIRAKNHSLLRVLQGKTVARQIKEIKDVKGAFAGDA